MDATRSGASSDESSPTNHLLSPPQATQAGPVLRDDVTLPALAELGEVGIVEHGGRRASVDPEAVIASVAARLRAVATPERAEHEKAYLRSDLDFLGASVPEVRTAARDVHRQLPGLTHDDLLALVDACWGMGIHELRMLAVELLVLSPELLSPDDADRIADLCRQARTWALVDPLAVQVAGQLVQHHAEAMDAVVRRWATDDDLWVRRASLLAHLGQVRRGAGDFARFGELADGMLEEREFFIRKAIGWVLREAGRARPDLVVAWLEPRVRRAAALTVREAVKYLPAEDRRRLLDRRAQT